MRAVVAVLGTVVFELELGFDERAALCVDPAWERLARLVVALVRRRYQMRTRSCCPLPRLVSFRC